ncbi:hypothetical protein, partial [Alistipes communis]|uniref:hypothetical protein n=1 Tax=Alistipes communis TaxID=2585118 RepID=UPI003AF8C461
MNTLFHFVVFVLIDCLSGTKVRIYLQQTILRPIFRETFYLRTASAAKTPRAENRAGRIKTARRKAPKGPRQNIPKISRRRIGVS